MPGKSRRRRGKYSAPSKKKKGRPGRPAVLAQQPVVAEAHRPAASPEVSVAPAEAPTTRAKPTVFRYPHIATELRTIGILGVIMLIVLAILALVLR